MQFQCRVRRGPLCDTVVDAVGRGGVRGYNAAYGVGLSGTEGSRAPGAGARRFQCRVRRGPLCDGTVSGSSADVPNWFQCRVRRGPLCDPQVLGALRPGLQDVSMPRTAWASLRPGQFVAVRCNWEE